MRNDGSPHFPCRSESVGHRLLRGAFDEIRRRDVYFPEVEPETPSPIPIAISAISRMRECGTASADEATSGMGAQ
ncbi:MAG: hypothetical protein QM757_30830 [Paludibaculum sp.]